MYMILFDGRLFVQSPGSHHGSEADELALADMRVRLLAGLKRYLHGKRLNGLLSSEVKSLELLHNASIPQRSDSP